MEDGIVGKLIMDGVGHCIIFANFFEVRAGRWEMVLLVAVLALLALFGPHLVRPASGRRVCSSYRDVRDVCTRCMYELSLSC